MFVTRLVYHYLFLKNSSLNCVNRRYLQISPTELRLQFWSTHYSTNGYAFFPDAVIRKAEYEITQYENSKRTTQPGPGQGGFAGGYEKQQQQNRFQPNPANWKQPQNSSRQTGKDMPAWKSFGGWGRWAVSPDEAPALLRKQHSTNDNYCIVNPVSVARSVACVPNVQKQDFSVTVQPPVLCPVVSPVHFVQERQSQKKDIRPSLKTKGKIKGVSIVDHCFCPKCSQCPNVAHAQLVGGRLQNF